MPVRSKVGSFLSGTAVAGSTVSVTGLGFTPKAMVFWGTGCTAVTVEANSISPFVGFSNNTDDMSAAGSCMNGAATPTCDNNLSLTRCISRMNSDGTDGGTAQVTAFGSDGFTITIGTQFAANVHINYLALGGEDIEAVKINNNTLPATATTKAITGVGFKPDVLLFISCTEIATGANTDLSFGFGVATRERAQNGGLAVKDIDGVATTDSAYYQRNGESLCGFTGTNVLTIRGAVQSFDADGFTINMVESNLGASFIFMAIKGGSWHLGNTTAPSDAVTTKTVSGFNFLPRSILFFAAELAENASDTPGSDAAFTMGARDALGNVIGSQWESYDGNADGACVRSQLTDSVLLDSNQSAGIEWKATIPALGPNGFQELNSVFTLGSGPFFFYLAIGDTDPNGLYMDAFV